MNYKRITILFAFFVATLGISGIAQNNDFVDVDYKVIAEGVDSPIGDLQIVCFNKYFNLDYLPKNFLKKYNLDDKTIYKKKMLIQIFRKDINNEGFDKIELRSIRENDNEFIIEYSVINSDKTNDDKSLAPFLIVQVPKSRKKDLKFISDGEKSENSNNLYINN